MTLICGNGFIQDYAAFSYNTRENRVGESSQFKIACFHGRVCVPDVGWWGKAEGTDK